MNRFKLWVMLLVASIIVCTSFLSYQHDLNELGKNWSLQDRWVFMLSTLSILLSFLGIVASVCPQERTVCRFESILVWSAVVLWCTGSVTNIIIIHPFQEGGDPSIVRHPSIYFFSIVCLIISILIMASWFKQFVVSDDSPTATYWILLGTMSFYAVVSSIAFRDKTVEVPVEAASGMNITNTTETIRMQQCEMSGFSCERATFATFISAISAGCCCIITPWRGISVRCQNDVCLLLFVSWCVGAGLLTFNTGPATNFGNLYLSVWFCVFLSLHLLIVTATSESSLGVASGRPSRRSSTTVGRGDILEVAYDAMEIRRRLASKPNKSDSYKDLFEPVEDWDGWHSTSSLEEGNKESVLQTGRESASHLYERRQVQRLEYWSMLLIASIVCLAAIFPDSSSGLKRCIWDKTALAIPSTSIVFSLLGIGTVLRSSNRAKVMEGMSILVCLVLWVSLLPVVTRKTTDIELGYEELNGPSSNQANVFFSCWMAVVTMLLLTTNWFRASFATQDWVLLGVFSIAIFATSIVFLDGSQEMTNIDGNTVDFYGCDESDAYECSEIKFAVYGGATCGALSLFMAILYRFSRWLHFSVALGCSILWGFAVTAISFSGGHGNVTGSVFFAVWINLFLSLDLMTMNFVLMWRKCQKKKTEKENGDNQNDNIKVTHNNQSNVPSMEHSLYHEKDHPTTEHTLSVRWHNDWTEKDNKHESKEICQNK